MRRDPSTRRQLRKVIITERDQRLCELLHSLGAMTRAHIQDCFEWSCVSDVNRRLRLLYDAGYLDRRLLPRTSGQAPAVYLLGREGAKLVTSGPKLAGQSVVRRRHRFKNMSDSLLPHELLIAEFYCLLIATFRRYQGCDMREWRCDEQILHLCNRFDEGADVELKPDAYGSYHLLNLVFNFFLEADRGTESLSRLRKKVELYRAFKASGLFQKNFERKAFRLLFVSQSTTRARNIARALPQAPDLKVFSGCIDDLRIDSLFGPVWFPAGSQEAQPLHHPAELPSKRLSI